MIALQTKNAIGYSNDTAFEGKSSLKKRAKVISPCLDLLSIENTLAILNKNGRVLTARISNKF